MAKPPATTTSRVGVWDELWATKLYVPHRPPDFVPRPRLLKRLDHGLGRGLVLVCAPAGFGKTALLAGWASSGHKPVAWLSLDPGDNDPARFWRYLVGALDRVWPGLDEQVTPLLDSPASPSFEGLVAVLVNRLAAEPKQGEALLILDDYHLIEAPPVHNSVEWLLERCPPGLHVVLASRANPPLPLARWRGKGQLTELRAVDLRFTAEEAAKLLREAVDIEVPEGAVAVLTARTEGWAAGLQLAALSLEGQPDLTAFVEAFSGSHRYVLDYLAEEVLDRQPGYLVRFLLETSVLERLSGPLCDAVCGRSDSQQLLEQIERANLFLVPLDDVRGWWRYHQLFTDLLRVRLQQQWPERVPALHRAAAAWSQERGLADDAVRHALAAGDNTWTAQLIEQHADRLMVRGESATLAQWLAALPTELIDTRPRLLLAQALLALRSGRLDGVEDRLEAAERALADAGGVADTAHEPSVGRGASLLTNVPAAIALDRAYLAELTADTQLAITLASGALRELGEDEWMLAATGRGYLAVAKWLDGQLAEAEQAFLSSLSRWREAGERFVAVRVCELLGHVQRAQGRLDAAVETYEQALEIATPPRRPLLSAAGIAHIGMAEVAYQRNELDAALEHVTEGIELCRPLTYTQALATGLATLAWIRQSRGNAAGALQTMDEAARAAPSPDIASLLNPVPAQRARLLLTQGDLAATARWISDRHVAHDLDQLSYSREPEYLVLARMLLAQKRPDQALELLGQMYATAAGQARTGSLIEIRTLQALALLASGNKPGAITALVEAASLAGSQGYVRVFADEGAPMAALLGELVTAQRRPSAADAIPFPYLGRLIRAVEPDATIAARRTSPSAPARDLVPPLTSRELEVLRLLAAGRENQAIARQLVVTVSTVKKHVTHILEKLGAANRTEATARARQLGLLTDKQ